MFRKKRAYKRFRTWAIINKKNVFADPERTLVKPTPNSVPVTFFVASPFSRRFAEIKAVAEVLGASFFHFLSRALCSPILWRVYSGVSPHWTLCTVPHFPKYSAHIYRQMPHDLIGFSLARVKEATVKPPCPLPSRD
uniref:Uncharacterized protein n=1 Tax=Sphaerodactylus townsendi TaxID=933632 RepID=A0ACB8G439_9SAUR